MTWRHIALAVAVAYALGAVLFPERFLWFNATFVDYTDSMLSYAGAFYLTNAFMHGGIQLWDRYDQMPMTFFHLNFGMYKFSNVLTALVYPPLSAFSKAPAQFFFSLFSFIFIFSALAIRTVGVYLLLSLFIRQRWILIAATVYGSVVIAPQFMMGLGTNIIYSLFPLIIYLVLRFIDEVKFDQLLLLGIVWMYCIATDLFCGLGYLYQAIHFVVVPGMAWMIWRHQKGLLKLRWKKEHTRKVLWAALLTVVMLAPTLYLIKANYHDYEFGLEKSRMKDPLSVTAYFTRPSSWAPQGEFLWRMVDFTENLWALNWVYVGPCLVFFALLGLCTIKDRRKWVLAGAALLFFLINSPRTAGGLDAAAHWLNAITNPLKFLPRSFHMSCALLMPFLLIPLAGGGFAWFCRTIANNSGPDHRGDLAENDLRWRISIGLFFAFAVAVMAPLPLPSRKALLFFIAGIALIWALKEFGTALGRVRKIAIIAVIIALFAADAWGMSKYVRGLLGTVLTNPRPVLARPDVGLVNMDPQNPRILPVRRYQAMASYRAEDTYLLEAAAGMPGIVFRYTNVLRYYQPISNYLPRHKAFAGWVNDGGVMMYYFNNDPRSMFLAKAAVSDGGDNLRQVLLKGLARDVAVVNGYPGLPDAVPALSPSAPPAPALKEVTIPWEKLSLSTHKGMLIAAFRVPLDLPRDEASTFLTPDQGLFRLTIDGKDLKTAQGNLVVPMTFDVNNVRDGWVTLALPAGMEGNITFMYPVAPSLGLTEVTKNNMDDFGFTYMGEAGWLIIHEAFDPKWKAYLDGKEVPFYKANQSFIGIPYPGGKHEVLLRYWPHTPIRFLLGISTLAAMACLIWILVTAVRRHEA